MFERILVPVDLTEKNEVAIDTVVRLAAHNPTTVTLLHVIETLALPFEELAQFYKELELRASQALTQLSVRLVKAGISPVDRVVLYGPRAEKAVQYAEENSIDLIVLNSHTIDQDNPGLGWATLSYKMAILAQCPVLLVK